MARAVREQRDQRLGLVRAALDRAAQTGQLVGELSVHAGDAGCAQRRHIIAAVASFSSAARAAAVPSSARQRRRAGDSCEIAYHLSWRRPSGQATWTAGAIAIDQSGASSTRLLISHTA